MKLRDLLTIVLAFILLCFEIFLVLSLSSLAAFFAWHLLVILILIMYVSFAYRHQGNLLYPLLLLVLTLCAGPFGLGTFLLTALLEPLFSLFATQKNTWLESLFPKTNITPFEEIIQRIGSRWDDYGHLNEASSFKNLFTYGSLLDKQTVLDTIATDFDPQYAPLLKEALNDSQNAVRIQAAAISTKIDNDFDKELKKLQKLHQESQDDLNTLLRLAEHTEAYTFAGVLDDLRQKEIAAIAVKYYRAYFQVNPESKNIWLAIGRLLFYQKDYADFILWYREGKKKFKILPTILHSWYLESLYKLGRYDEFAASIRGA